MKNYILAAAIALISTSSYAGKGESFFNKKIDEYWSVYGTSYAPDDEKTLKPAKPPACFAENRYRDGSIFQLSIDPGVGTLYIWFKDHKWEIDSTNINKAYKFQLNMFNDTKLIDGAELTLIFEGKNVIKVPNLGQKPFFKAFGASNKMVFVMPGTMKNSTVLIPRTKEILQAFKECIFKFEKTYNE